MVDLPTVSTLLVVDGKEGILSTGDSTLDHCLDGGIPLRTGVVEIAGEAGVGKTQLVLTMLLTAQLPVDQGGLGSGAVYVSTEGPTHLSRLCSLAKARYPTEMIDTLLSNIFAYEFIEPEEVWQFLMRTLPLLLATRVAKLVVIDSITAPLRGEFEKAEHRTDWFFGLSSAMKRLSDEFGVLFVVTNQMSWDMNNAKLKPSLGLAWSTCVNERWILEFDNTSCTPDNHARKRALSVCFSPRLPDGKVATLQLEARGFFVQM